MFIEFYVPKEGMNYSINVHDIRRFYEHDTEEEVEWTTLILGDGAKVTVDLSYDSVKEMLGFALQATAIPTK